MLYYDYANHIVPQLLCLCADPEGEGVRTPPLCKLTKLQGFIAILVRIPCKITKLPSLGHHRPASDTPFYGFQVKQSDTTYISGYNLSKLCAYQISEGLFKYFNILVFYLYINVHRAILTYHIYYFVW